MNTTTKLPVDASMLPISDGALLVSREHAVFCHVPASQVDAVICVLSGQKPLDVLGPKLRMALREHGFFEEPRSPKPDPPSVQIQITNECSLACSYCCTNSGKPRSYETDFQALVRVVRQIPEVLGYDTRVGLLGGEPLLVPWSLELANEVVQLGLRLTIFTNGVHLADDSIAAEVAALIRRGVKVRVSLGGPTAETCDQISGDERFEPTLLGIQNLAELGGRVSVDVMLTPQNAEAIAVELSNLRKRLPNNTPVSLGVLYRSGREIGEHLFENRRELESVLDRIAFDAGVSIKTAATSPLTNRRDGCVCAMGKHIHLRSDGGLYNCFKMEEEIGRLDTIGFAAAARLIRDNPHPAHDLPTCADCPLATICGGGCRSENFLYTGDPNTPSCGSWRVRVLSELLAEEQITAVDWPLAFLLDEARRRAIPTPDDVFPRTTSRHLIDV